MKKYGRESIHVETSTVGTGYAIKDIVKSIDNIILGVEHVV